MPMEFSLSYGPLAYFHVVFIKNPNQKFKLGYLWHFLPSLLIDVILFTAFFSYIKTDMAWAYANVPKIQATALLIALLGILQLGVYVYLIYQESTRTKNALKEFKKVQQWLKIMTIAWCSLITFLILAIPIALYFINKLDENSSLFYKPLGSIIGLCIYILGYAYAMKYIKAVDNYTTRLKNLKLSFKALDEKKELLVQLLLEDKLYKNPQLTVAKLAKHLNWPINQLSTIINQGFQTNFTDFINHHRIEAFKKKMIQPDSKNYSIVGLGLEVGFSSKASFYRSFKKETGMTPSDYLKSLE